MKKHKAIQLFSDEYLEQCSRMTPTQIAQFLEAFRKMHGPRKKDPSKLISMKIPESLLLSFKVKAKLNGIPYRTQIKALMKAWLQE